MMIKVFTTNKDGKIELTKDELKALLDEAYWDGYRANNHVYVYNTPSWSPYQWSVTTSGSTCGTTKDATITLSNACESNVASINARDTVVDSNGNGITGQVTI